MKFSLCKLCSFALVVACLILLWKDSTRVHVSYDKGYVSVDEPMWEASGDFAIRE